MQEDEPEAYNSFLKDLRKTHEGKRRDDFWQQVVQRGLTLIHCEESEESNVTPQEAKEVMQWLNVQLTDFIQFFNVKAKPEDIVDPKSVSPDADSVDALLMEAE